VITSTYLQRSGGTLTGDLMFSDSGTAPRGIYGNVGTGDGWRLIGGASAGGSGWLELATADDGNEPIYVRQYSYIGGTGNKPYSKFGTIIRTATLLDESGNTSFPGTVTASSILASRATLTGNLTNSTTWTANRVAVVNGSNTLSTATITTTELGYLSGTSANVQVQLNGMISAVSSYNIDGIGNTSAVETNITKLKLVGAYTSASTTSFGEIFNDYTNNKANGSYSHSEGANTKSLGFASHAEGILTLAQGKNSHSEGMSTSAMNTASHAEGSLTLAQGGYSHAEGRSTSAIAGCSHAEGDETIASGQSSHSEGYLTSAIGMYSHSEGTSTIASGDNQHVQGKYNIADTTSAFILGNGTAVTAQSNAMTVDWSGNTEIAGYCISHSTLEITNANVSTYYVTGASYNTLYIPYGYDTVIYSAPTAGTINQVLIVDNISTKNNKMFNGYKLNIIAVGNINVVSYNSNVKIGYFSYWIGNRLTSSCGSDVNSIAVSPFDELCASKS
jgi:hypothetical protein